MKIGINWRLVDQNQPTGVQNYTTNLYKTIKYIDKNNEYIKLSSNLPDNLMFNSYFDNWKIKSKLKKVNLYHSPAITLPLGQKVCFYVCTIHDLAFKAFPHWGSKLFLSYYDFTVKNALKKADTIIVDSKFTRTELKKYYDTKGVDLKIIPLGVNRYFFEKESKIYLNKVKKKYNLTRKQVIFANSAHSQRKNVVSLIKAFKQTNLPKDVVLLIAGYKNKPDYLTSDLSNQIFPLGYLPKREIRAIYQICDLFVYPSVYEGFGLPILEAMASNAIVLTSNIPPLQELVPNKKLRFDPRDINQISRKINYYLAISSEDEKKIKKEYRSILEEHQWEKTAKKTLNVFKKFK